MAMDEPYTTGLLAVMSLGQRLRMAGMLGHDVRLELEPAEAVLLADALESAPGFGALGDPEEPTKAGAN